MAVLGSVKGVSGTGAFSEGGYVYNTNGTQSRHSGICSLSARFAFPSTLSLQIVYLVARKNSKVKTKYCHHLSYSPEETFPS